MSYEGIYTSNFLDKYLSRAKNFECFKCHLVSPKNYVIECQHCICQKCNYKTKYCSICQKQKIITKGENPTAFQFILTEIIINPYLMKCIFSPCNWQGTYQDFIKGHYEVCKFRGNKELKKEYLEEFKNDESSDKSGRSKSEIKCVKKNIKNKFLLNNNYHYDILKNDEKKVIEIFENDEIENHKNNKIYNEEPKKEISSYNYDFAMVHDNNFSIKNGILNNYKTELNRGNEIIQYKQEEISNSEKEENFIELKSDDEIIINLNNEKDNNNNGTNEEEKEGEIEEEELEEEDGENKFTIEIMDDEEDEENESDIEEEEEEEEEENVEEDSEKDEYNNILEKDTSKETKEKEKYLKEIKIEKQKKGYEYIEEDDEEEIEILDEDEENEEEEIKSNTKIQYKNRNFTKKKSQSYNNFFLKKKRNNFRNFYDSMNEKNEEEEKNDYNNNYKRRRFEY